MILLLFIKPSIEKKGFTEKKKYQIWTYHKIFYGNAKTDKMYRY